MKNSDLKDIITTAISKMEAVGFNVLGLTTDQGSNFESLFGGMGVSPDNPKFDIDGKKYLVMRDPPHLLKNARNFLERNAVKVPGFTAPARWDHVKFLFHLDSKSSLKLAPKLTSQHVEDLLFSTKMKVKFATHVMSNTVSSALDTLISANEIDTSAAATSSFLKHFNDLFDCLNSLTLKDKVPLRRPISIGSETIAYLKESIGWLKELQEANNTKVKFIMGWVQSIRVVLELVEILSGMGIKYLSTRNLCQDPLELLFGKIRTLAKFPDPFTFSSNYARISTSSLVRAPSSGNCDSSEDHLWETISIMTAVSNVILVFLLEKNII